jgi:molybdopterin-guanine dinucleotide biosynthesis protein
MPPLVSIVGKSESGTMTLIEKMVKELKSRMSLKISYRAIGIDSKASAEDISWQWRQDIG